MLVGFPVGGGADVAARAIGPRLSETLKQQIIVDNRPGAGSAIASEMTAKAAADGYTLVMIGSSHAVNAGFQKQLPYHPVNDFTAIILVASAPVALTANPATQLKTLNEIITLAKTRPGYLNVASAGAGGINHLAGELLKGMVHINLTHVPYKGVSQALPALIAGEVQLMFSSLPGVLEQIKAGRVTAIAVTSSKRSTIAPDIPTIAESGVPGYEATSWYGLLAPARTPKRIVDRLNAAVQEALHRQDISMAIVRQGAEPRGGTPGEFDAYLRSEVAKWTKAIANSGIRPE